MLLRETTAKPSIAAQGVNGQDVLNRCRSRRFGFNPPFGSPLEIADLGFP